MGVGLFPKSRHRRKTNDLAGAVNTISVTNGAAGKHSQILRCADVVSPPGGVSLFRGVAAPAGDHSGPIDMETCPDAAAESLHDHDAGSARPVEGAGNAPDIADAGYLIRIIDPVSQSGRCAGNFPNIDRSLSRYPNNRIPENSWK